MKKIRSLFGLRTLKTAIAAGLAIFISNLMGLDYAANSGIIVILSVQNTKKKSGELARQRLFATLIALALGSLVFLVLGYTAWAFAIYLLLFIPIAVRLGMNDSIVPCSVLVSHLLAVQSVAPASLVNEFMQMVIGAGLALLVNLHIPSMRSRVADDIHAIENQIREVLLDLAACLRSESRRHDQSLLVQLESLIDEGRTRALQESLNYPGKQAYYDVRYMDMRSSQFEVLKHLGRYVDRVRLIDGQAHLAAALTEHAASRVTSLDPGEVVLRELADYREQFERMELPKTRQEFECQASIHDFVSDLELLMDLKHHFLV